MKSRQAGAEIEITPEAVEAGTNAVMDWFYDREEQEADERESRLAIMVYRAMTAHNSE